MAARTSRSHRASAAAPSTRPAEIPLRRNAAGDETRQQLLVIAERLFAEFGIDGVSIRQIAAEAGLRNPAAVNYHFGDKEALVSEILVRHAAPINDRRRDMIDKLIASKRVTVRTLAEAVVLPLAAELDLDGHYLGFLAQLARSRPALLTDFTGPAFSAGVPKLQSAIAAIGAEPPAPFSAVRAAVTTTMLPAVLADYQRAMRAGQLGLTPAPLFISYLVDLVAASMSCQPSTTSLGLLKGRKR